MNRLARKYRDMGDSQPMKTIAPQAPQLGFVIDRQGAGIPEPKEVELLVEEVEEVEEETHKKPVKVFTEQEESGEEDSSKKRPSKRPRREKWADNPEENEETLNALESAVFSQSGKLADNFEQKASERELKLQDSDYESSSDEKEEAKTPEKRVKTSAVWQDDEDEEQSAANREKYEQLVGQPRWALKAEKRLKKKQNNKETTTSGEVTVADSSSDSDDDDDEDGFRKMRSYITTAVPSSSSSADPTLAALPGGQTLHFARCADLNQELRHFAQISAIDFYPLSTLALVASHDSSLKLFQVDGKTNALVHSIVMKQWPIQQARFNAATQEIFMQCSIPQASFYGYDLMAEKTTFYNRYRDQGCAPFRNMTIAPDGQSMAFSTRCGYVNILSTRTKEIMFQVKRNGEVGGLALSGNNLFACGNDSEVFVWDVRQQRRCLNRFNDSGCIHGTCLTVSQDGSLIACGSDSGVVNLYKTEDCLSESDPKPLKVFKNIVTPVSGITMNNSAELMVAWSAFAPRVVKTIHLPSRCVYANFPEPEDLRLKNVSAVALSPNSGFMAAGNSNGRVLLWRLRHFSSY